MTDNICVNDKPHKCEHCDKPYVKLYGLTRHLKVCPQKQQKQQSQNDESKQEKLDGKTNSEVIVEPIIQPVIQLVVEPTFTQSHVDIMVKNLKSEIGELKFQCYCLKGDLRDKTKEADDKDKEIERKDEIIEEQKRQMGYRDRTIMYKNQDIDGKTKDIAFLKTLIDNTGEMVQATADALLKAVMTQSVKYGDSLDPKLLDVIKESLAICDPNENYDDYELKPINF